MKKDKYLDATERISAYKSHVGTRYRSFCQIHYTDTKHSMYFLPVVTHKKARIETRQSSIVPKSEKQGLLEGTCIFCGKSCKKTKRRT